VAGPSHPAGSVFNRLRLRRSIPPEYLHRPQNLALGVQLRTGARVRRLEPVIKRGPT
jgi:hypothetical protein